jgi:anti-sigma regulatory factor (Ser/Thr protein kinase)
MATVELRFSAQPEHVRTARLVAAAVARRARVDEAVLDEVRLAVGEACTRAVSLHRSNGLDQPVRVLLTEEEKKFTIEVGDHGPGPAEPSAAHSDDHATTRPAPPEPDADEEADMGLAVISGLVEDVEVSVGEGGGVIRMSWPTTPAAATT